MRRATPVPFSGFANDVRNCATNLLAQIVNRTLNDRNKVTERVDKLAHAFEPV